MEAQGKAAFPAVSAVKVEEGLELCLVLCVCL